MYFYKFSTIVTFTSVQNKSTPSCSTTWDQLTGPWVRLTHGLGPDEPGLASITHELVDKPKEPDYKYPACGVTGASLFPPPQAWWTADEEVGTIDHSLQRALYRLNRAVPDPICFSITFQFVINISTSQHFHPQLSNVWNEQNFKRFTTYLPFYKGPWT